MSDLQTVSGLPVKKYWQGSVVEKCDICQRAIVDCFYSVFWANMCPNCFQFHASELGTNAQKLQKTECVDGTKFVTLWVKIES